MNEIVAPVSRCIGVQDPARSAAFYRDVLGFEGDESEVVRGPARIEFTKEEAPRRAILFFQAADVKALRAAILERGGAPSDLERVNWIKMEMFEARDPDGHTLWFGQSFDVPHSPGPAPMFIKTLPELPVDDVPAAIEYYQKVLGFRINYAQHDLGVMDRDRITILLIARTERHTGIGSFGNYIENADELYAELKAKGANVQGEPVSYPWGLRAFHVLDLEGNRITFSQTFE
jgi:catechol 2,3-dioxygenase-like lactoylglutathione lyase family enzyme